MSELAAGTNPRPTDLKPLAKGTLSRRLIWRVSALVALVAIVLSIATTSVVAGMLVQGVDSQLRSAAGIQTTDRGPRGGLQPRGPGSSGIEVVVTDDVVITAVYFEHGQPTTLTEEQVEALLAVTADSKEHTVDLPGLGSYRVLRTTSPSADHIVALPMDGVWQGVSQLVVLEIIITAIAVGAAGFIVQIVVRSSLRPLNRLAQTATIVSQKPLDKGEVDLSDRVADADAQPTNEVGRVGIAFNHMLDNVEDALAARQRSETRVRQFVADASHELRNPLAAIRGYAELTARRSEDLPTDAAFAIGRIEAESARMSSLVEDMLLLARLDNDAQLQLADVDLVEVALNATQDARAAGPDHVWRLHLPNDAVTVRADANQLHQVVTNLLSNARKHTPPGTQVDVSVAIEGVHSPEGPRAVLRVHDNGPGVPPEIKDQVFERFARADVARAHNPEGSTGLGLAIVASVVGHHGGQTSLESGPGFTEFIVRLPLAESAPTIEASAS